MFHFVTFRIFGILKLRLLRMMSYLLRRISGLTICFSNGFALGSSGQQFCEVSLKQLLPTFRQENKQHCNYLFPRL